MANACAKSQLSSCKVRTGHGFSTDVVCKGGSVCHLQCRLRHTDFFNVSFKIQLVLGTGETSSRNPSLFTTKYCSCSGFLSPLTGCFFSPLQINKLVEYYQQLAQKEKIERDRKKLVRRRNYMPLAFSVSWEFCALRPGEGTHNSLNLKDQVVLVA